MNFIMLFFLALFSYFYFWIKKRQNYWKDRGFESDKLESIFGSFKGVGTEKCLVNKLDDYYREFKGKGKAVGLFSFVKPLLLITDPGLLKNILIQNFDTFHDRYLYYNQEDDPISVHLLALRGNKWRERRAKLTPTFTSGKMKLMFDTVQIISDQLVNIIENSIKTSSKAEVHDIVARYTTDVISNVALGLDSNSLNNPNSEIRKRGKDVLDFGAMELLRFHFTCSFPDISKKLHLTANKPNVIDFFYNTFRKNIEQREFSKSNHNDFMQILLELKKSSTLTVDELAAESFLFFLGGFETSSTLISFALYELALNPDIQSRLRMEIKEAVEESDGNFSYDVINKLEYLDMVVNEALRMYPPAFNLIRTCNRDFTIPETDLVIPKGVDIMVNIYSFHHDPEYFPEPEKFNPERFAPEYVKSRQPCTFLPFGDGPRRCIGGRFGMMQSKMGIAKLIYNFEFSPCNKTLIPMKFSPSGIFLESARQMWLNIEKV